MSPARCLPTRVLARDLGLPAGIPVFGGGGDQAAARLVPEP